MAITGFERAALLLFTAFSGMFFGWLSLKIGNSNENTNSNTGNSGKQKNQSGMSVIYRSFCFVLMFSLFIISFGLAFTFTYTDVPQWASMYAILAGLFTLFLGIFILMGLVDMIFAYLEKGKTHDGEE